MKKLMTISIIALIAILSTLDLSAQKTEDDKLPFEQIGFGVTLGSMGDYGVLGTYAITKDLQIGTKLGAYWVSAYKNGSIDIDPVTYFTIAPFVKYYFEKVKYAYPFLKATFAAEMYDETIKTNGIPSTNSVNDVNLNIYAGADWYPYKGLCVTTGLRAIQYNMDPSKFSIGLGNAYLGVIFFL